LRSLGNNEKCGRRERKRRRRRKKRGKHATRNI